MWCNCNRWRSCWVNNSMLAGVLMAKVATRAGLQLVGADIKFDEVTNWSKI